MYDDDIFESIIAEAVAEQRKEDEAVLNEWLNKIGYKKPIGYHKNILSKELVVYTANPGVFIGEAGSKIREFVQFISDRFGAKWTVKLIEVRGGFINPMSIEKQAMFDQMLATIEEWKESTDLISLDTVANVIKAYGKVTKYYVEADNNETCK